MKLNCVTLKVTCPRKKCKRTWVGTWERSTKQITCIKCNRPFDKPTKRGERHA